MNQHAHPESPLDQLRSLQIGSPLRVPAGMLVPLFGNAHGPNAMLLEEGIRAGVTAFTEAPDGPRVNQIRVRHAGEQPLLLLDSDMVIGSMQDRTFTTSSLLPAGWDGLVPVCCIEQQRWRPESARFGASEQTMPSSTRVTKVARVTREVVRTGRYVAPQDEVWRDVDHYLTRTQVRSRTRSLYEGVTRQTSERSDSDSGLQAADGQVGLALLRGDAIVSLDVLPSAEVFTRAFRKLIRGVLSDAPQRSEVRGSIDPARVILDTLEAAARTATTRPAPWGVGAHHHGLWQGHSLSAISYGGSLYHVALAGSG